MTAALHACQGGWCQRRELCANYHHGLVPAGEAPSDRLCERGRDGDSEWALVVQLNHIEIQQKGEPHDGWKQEASA